MAVIKSNKPDDGEAKRYFWFLNKEENCCNTSVLRKRRAFSNICCNSKVIGNNCK